MSFFTDALLRPGPRIPAWPIQQEPSARDLPGEADAIIIGAGVIGLAIGWRLAQAGLRTIVLERGRAGEGASLAATGMLAAAAELEAGGETFLPFALSSQRLWREFGPDLEAPTTWLMGADARRLEPGLRSPTAAALHCADDHQVDPRRLVPRSRSAMRGT